MIWLFFLQAATAQAPDIQLQANVRARQVTIEKQGKASLTVATSPGDGGNLVDVEAPKANGRKTLRNVEVNLRAEARIAPATNQEQAETSAPQ